MQLQNGTLLQGGKYKIEVRRIPDAIQWSE